MVTVSPVRPVVAKSLVDILSQKREKVDNELPTERLIEIASANPIVNTFLRLAVIPTPTIRPGHPQEDGMKQNMKRGMDLYVECFKELGIPDKNFEIDNYGSLIIRVPGSSGYEDKQPIMLMGHMDVVPADLKDPLHPIHPVLIMHMHPIQNTLKEYLASDGTTTLGVDDKALLAIIRDVVRKLKEENISHVPIEIVVAPDEEEEGTSLVNLDASKFNAKYIIVLDDDRAFKVTFGCGSFVNIKIDIDGLQSGHSADDNQGAMISAADVLKELHDSIGNRVIKYFTDFKVPLISKNIYEYEIDKTASNRIPAKGHIYLSLRSNVESLEREELNRIQEEVKRIEQKYKGTEKGLQIKINIHKEMPPWNGDPKSLIATLLIQSAKEMGHEGEIKIAPSHGATQVNNLVGKKNHRGEEFIPVIIGVDSEGWHSTKEKVDWKSMVEVSDWLYRVIQNYMAEKNIP